MTDCNSKHEKKQKVIENAEATPISLTFYYIFLTGFKPQEWIIIYWMPTIAEIWISIEDKFFPF